jgi:PAS domain S-box-containing protein
MNNKGTILVVDNAPENLELPAAQQIIEGIINAIPVRVFWKDKNLVYLGCNAGFARDAGFANPKDIIGKDDYHLAWGDRAELYRGDDRQVIESGCAKLLIEEPQTTPEGKTITVLTSKIPLRGPNGEISGLLGVYMDITERKRTEEVLRASAQRIRLLLDSITEGLYGVDTQGNCVFINHACLQMLGYDKEEDLLGRHIHETIHHTRPDGTPYPAEECHMYEALRRGAGTHVDDEVFWRRDGTSLPVEYWSHPMFCEGRVMGAVATFFDITERKRAELRIEAFSKLGQKLSAAKTAREAAGIISEVAGELLGWDACSFSLCSPSGDLLYHVLNVDTIAGRRVESSPRYAPASTLARRAIELGGQLILKEEPNQMMPGAQPFGDSARPSASIMYVPVRKGAEVVGVMSIQSYTPGAYDRRSLETLQALADHCGGALDRLRMEEAWRTTQQRLGHLLDQSPAVIYSLKTDGKTTEPVWVSDNVERLLGCTVAECNGSAGLFGQVHPQDRQEVIDGIVQLLAKKQISRDYRIRHKNGDYRWVRDEQRLVCDAGGGRTTR